MPKVRVNGVELCYRQTGKGADLVLIHGLAANHAFWNPELLLPLARRYRVTTYDLRGHGYSEMAPAGYASADMAGDLIGLMDRLGIEWAHLLGHSFGGSVAAQAAVRYGQRVRSLTLADTRLVAFQPTQRLREWPDWKQAKAQLESYGVFIDENEEEVGLRLLEIMADPKWRETRQRAAKQALFIPFGGWSAGNRSAMRWLKLIRTTTARQEFPRLAGLTEPCICSIRHPMLAVYGQHSRCMVSCEKIKACLPGCRTVVVPNGGHFYPVTKGSFLARSLLDFLDDVAAGEVIPADVAPTDSGETTFTVLAEKSGDETLPDPQRRTG